MWVEGEQIRRLSQIRIEEMINQANASDTLKYDDYVWLRLNIIML